MDTLNVSSEQALAQHAWAAAAHLAQCEPASFDAVLLDVNNGLGQLVYERNAGLYTSGALARGLSRCTSEGALVLWSAEHSPALVQRLRRTGTSVHHEPVAVTLQGRETHYHLYVAHPPRR